LPASFTRVLAAEGRASKDATPAAHHDAYIIAYAARLMTAPIVARAAPDFDAQAH